MWRKTAAAAAGKWKYPLENKTEKKNMDINKSRQHLLILLTNLFFEMLSKKECLRLVPHAAAEGAPCWPIDLDG